MATYMDAVEGKHTDGTDGSEQEEPSRYEQLMSMMTRTEGREGVKTLARLSRELGYVDRTYYGQLGSDCSIGDLIEFLEDNPGAISAVCNWILENYS